MVDAGRARRARFDPGSGMSRLVTERVTRAEAEQRRGRAGRVAPGWCYRLWTRGEEGALAAFPPPEIASADLAALALELALWGVCLAGRHGLPDPAAGPGLRRGAGASGRARRARRRRARSPTRAGRWRRCRSTRGSGTCCVEAGRPGAAALAADLAALAEARDPLRGRRRGRRRPRAAPRRAARSRAVEAERGGVDRAAIAALRVEARRLRRWRPAAPGRRPLARRGAVARLSRPHRPAPAGAGAALSALRRQGRAPRRRTIRWPPRRCSSPPTSTAIRARRRSGWRCRSPRATCAPCTPAASAARPGLRMVAPRPGGGRPRAADARRAGARGPSLAGRAARAGHRGDDRGHPRPRPRGAALDARRPALRGPRGMAARQRRARSARLQAGRRCSPGSTTGSAPHARRDVARRATSPASISSPRSRARSTMRRASGSTGWRRRRSPRRPARALPVDYAGAAPLVSVRLQEMFGLTRHPTLGPRRGAAGDRAALAGAAAGADHRRSPRLLGELLCRRPPRSARPLSQASLAGGSGRRRAHPPRQAAGVSPDVANKSQRSLPMNCAAGLPPAAVGGLLKGCSTEPTGRRKT